MEQAFTGLLVRYNISEKSTSGRSTCEDELHVNLWEIGKPFIDIGLMINQWKKEIDSVELVLPWVLGKLDIYDLASSINNELCIGAIFNETAQYKGRANNRFSEITLIKHDENNSDKNKNNTFELLTLSSDDFLVEERITSDGDKYSVVTIKLPNIDSINPTSSTASDEADSKEISDRLYMRFRIIKIPSAFYQSKFNQADSNILSSYKTTRIIDFRINVRRGVPKELLIAKSTSVFPSLKKIHFFLTIDRSQECIFRGQNFIGCRSLTDEEVWNHYVNSHSACDISTRDSVKNYLGYQWSTSNEKTVVKDLIALGRFSNTESSTMQILRFITLGLVFGMAGNGLWELAMEDCNELFLYKLRVILCIVGVGLAIIFVSHLLRWKKICYNSILDKIINFVDRLKIKN